MKLKGFSTFPYMVFFLFICILWGISPIILNYLNEKSAEEIDTQTIKIIERYKTYDDIISDYDSQNGIYIGVEEYSNGKMLTFEADDKYGKRRFLQRYFINKDLSFKKANRKNI